jgi:hypothetical protein
MPVHSPCGSVLVSCVVCDRLHEAENPFGSMSFVCTDCARPGSKVERSREP